MAVVLAVDDEESIRKLVTLILAASGHEVMTACNGVEGIALYRSYPDRIHLVITDMKMPVMGGGEMVHLIRETRPEAKIICMSGYTETAFPDGVTVLWKPFKPDALRECVARVLP
jgi:YesN/AraC family two-component response regulator